MFIRISPVQLIVILASALMLLGCSGEKTRKTTSKVTGKTVENIKGMLTGVVDGVEEGRKQTIGLDGALVVTTKEDLAGKVGISVYRLEDNPSGNAMLTFALSNQLDVPVRVSGLAQGHNMVMLDPEGFAITLVSRERDITIPPRAKERAAFIFGAPASQCKTFRLFGEEVALPAPDVSSAAADEAK